MKRIITVIFLFIAFSVSAQEDLDEFKSFKTDKKQDDNVTSYGVFKLSFLFPAIGGEVRLGEKFSLDLSGRLRINAGINSNGSSTHFWFYPQPEIHLEPKWNYNIRKRKEKGKKTTKFSSNFVSVHSSFNIKVSPFTASYLIVGPTWGMQRNMGKIGYFKFNTGLGYRHIFGSTGGNPRSAAVPILNLHLGLMF